MHNKIIKLALAFGGALVATSAFAGAPPPSTNPAMPSQTQPADPSKRSTGTDSTQNPSFDSSTTKRTTPSMNTKSDTIVGDTTIGTMTGAFKMDMINGWPTESRDAAAAMVAKYGVPTEFTSTALIWKDKGDFEKIMVLKDAIDHQFPMAHKDVLLQVVKYKVPADKADDLVQFDGSLLIDRTRGTLGARCDSEENNYVALNLADEIVRGKKTVKQARDTLAKIAMNGKVAGNESMFKEGLKFQVATSETADADRAMPMGR